MSVAVLDRPDIHSVLDSRVKRLDGYAYKLAGGQYGMDAAYDGPMDIDRGRMSVVIPFADGNRRDGVGDLLEVGGIRTERHRLNPVVLWDHGKQCAIPIGLAEDQQTKEYTVQIDTVNQKASVRAFFYQGKGVAGVDNGTDSAHALFCEQLFDLIAQGYVRAGSIGYQVIKALQLPADYERGTPQGLHLLVTLMLEASAVVMPANGDTVRKVLGMHTVCGKKLSPWLVKSLEPYAEPRKAQLGHEGKGIRQGQKVKIGDRVEGIYQPGIDNIAFSGRVESVSMEQSGYGPSSYGLATIRLDKPISRYGSTDTALLLTVDRYGVVNDSKYDLKSLPGTTAPVPHGDMSQTHVQPPRWNPGVGAVKRFEIRHREGYGGRPAKWEVCDTQSRDESSFWAFDTQEEAEKKKRELEQWESQAAQRRAKALPNIRRKYRSVKSVRHRCRKSAPGSSVSYIAEKDLAAAEKDAKSRGVTFTKAGHGAGGVRVKLIGDDTAIDELAKRYGVPQVKSMSGNDADTIRSIVERLQDPDGAVQITTHTRSTIYTHEHRDLFRMRGSDPVVVQGGREVSIKYASVRLGYRSKAMKAKTKAMPDETATADSAADSVTVESDEPLSAQILRKWHADVGNMMTEYDSYVGPLEHEGVKKRLLKKLEDLESEMSELEDVFGKEHKDLPGLGGSADDEEGEEAAAEDSVEAETKEGSDDSGEGGGGEVDTMEDDANPAPSSSGPADDVPAEEAAETMREQTGDDPDKKDEKKKDEKALRDPVTKARMKYRKKAMPNGKVKMDVDPLSDADTKPWGKACPKCGKSPCVCKGAKYNDNPRGGTGYDPQLLDEAIRKLQNFISTGTAGFFQQGWDRLREAGIDVELRKAPTPENARALIWTANDKKDKNEKSMPDDANPPGVTDAIGTDTLEDQPENPPGYSTGLEPQHKQHVGEAGGFLGELATTQEFGDEHRMKSYHYHKTLEGIAKFFAGKDFADQEDRRDTDQEMAAKSAKRAKSAKDFADLPDRRDTDQELAAGTDTANTENKMGACCKAIGAASEFLGRMSQERAFGDPHREEATAHAKALEPFYADPEQPEPVGADPERADLTPDPGSPGEKSLALSLARKLDATSQATAAILERLNKRMQSIRSIRV